MNVLPIVMVAVIVLPLKWNSYWKHTGLWHRRKQKAIKTKLLYCHHQEALRVKCDCILDGTVESNVLRCFFLTTS